MNYEQQIKVKGVDRYVIIFYQSIGDLSRKMASFHLLNLYETVYPKLILD